MNSRPGYYLRYDGKTIGPIAPDNPKWDFSDTRMIFKCQMFAKEMKKEFGVIYEVVHVAS